MSKPRILIYDIETAPNLAYVWGKYDQNVIAFAKEREMLSFSYCWLGESSIHHENRKGQKSDKQLVKKMADLLSEADVCIAHNGNRFDRLVVKTRMLYWNMKPLKQAVSVDTKVAAKKYFAFNGNSLDDLCGYLKIGSKLKTMSFSVWLGCMADKPKSWRIMQKYNDHDVRLLKQVYKRMASWIEDHPTLRKVLDPNYGQKAVYGRHDHCPHCQGDHTQSRGYRRTRVHAWRILVCMDCGKWFTGERITR